MSERVDFCEVVVQSGDRRVASGSRAFATAIAFATTWSSLA